MLAGLRSLGEFCPSTDIELRQRRGVFHLAVNVNTSPEVAAPGTAASFSEDAEETFGPDRTQNRVHTRHHFS